jgi:predicted SnoaL-like aldol condensation-catalyzing enzyme
MTLEENKAVVRRFWEKAFDDGGLEMVDKLFAPDHALHYPGLREEGEGLDAMKALVSLFHSVSPDFRINVQDEIAEEDKVVVRWAGSGNVREEIAGEAGVEARVSGIAISRVVRGDIKETWLRFAAHPDESWALVPQETTLEQLSLNPFISDPMGPRGRIICLIFPPACHPEGPHLPDDPPRPDG